MGHPSIAAVAALSNAVKVPPRTGLVQGIRGSWRALFPEPTRERQSASCQLHYYAALSLGGQLRTRAKRRSRAASSSRRLFRRSMASLLQPPVCSSRRTIAVCSSTSRFAAARACWASMMSSEWGGCLTHLQTFEMFLGSALGTDKATP
jgi:hypothetical protein